MRVGSDETVGVADQNKIAVALELAAGIGDHAVLRCFDRRAFRHREIDSVILHAIRLGTERDNDTTAHRPAETRQAARRLRRLHRIVWHKRASWLGDPHSLRGIRHGERAGRRRNHSLCPRRCRLRGLLDFRNGNAVAGFHFGVDRKVVGPGDHRDWLVVDPSNAVKRLTRRHDVHHRRRDECPVRGAGRRRRTDRGGVHLPRWGTCLGRRSWSRTRGGRVRTRAAASTRAAVIGAGQVRQRLTLDVACRGGL